jgi:hypothetical protein
MSIRAAQQEVQVEFHPLDIGAIKKHSIRMKTDERLGGNYPLADQYVPRSVLELLGLSEDEQNDPTLSITITWTLS